MGFPQISISMKFQLTIKPNEDLDGYLLGSLLETGNVPAAGIAFGRLLSAGAP